MNARELVINVQHGIRECSGMRFATDLEGNADAIIAALESAGYLRTEGEVTISREAANVIAPVLEHMANQSHLQNKAWDDFIKAKAEFVAATGDADAS